MPEQQIKAFLRTELCVYGKDFRLARYQKKISLVQLAEAMRQRGWTYYPQKIHRCEQQERFCLAPGELHDLLSCLGVEVASNE